MLCAVCWNGQSISIIGTVIDTCVGQVWHVVEQGFSKQPMDQIWPANLPYLALDQFKNMYKHTGKWCLFGPGVSVLELSLVLYSLPENPCCRTCTHASTGCYHLVDMNTSILLVESQVILNCITGFKSKNILECAFKAKTCKAQCAWCIWLACVSKVLPQTGHTVACYLFDYGNMENINLNILLGCLVV